MDTNLRMLFDSIPRECSTKHAAGLLTYCSFVQPSHLIGSDLDMEQTILQITAAGLCQNLTGFPKTECGCKGTTKNAHTQVMRVFFYKKIRAVKKQAPVRRLVKVLCMRDLLYFHSHDVIRFTITENEELTVEDEFVCICIRYSNCCC